MEEKEDAVLLVVVGGCCCGCGDGKGNETMRASIS
jgi:hypothetical protein